MDNHYINTSASFNVSAFHKRIKEVFNDENLEDGPDPKYIRVRFLLRLDYFYEYLKRTKDDTVKIYCSISSFLSYNPILLQYKNVLDLMAQSYGSNKALYMIFAFKSTDKSLYRHFYDMLDEKELLWCRTVINDICISSVNDSNLEILIHMWPKLELPGPRCRIGYSDDTIVFQCNNFVTHLIEGGNIKMLKFCIEQHESQTGRQLLISYDFFFAVFSGQIGIADYLLTYFDTPKLDETTVPFYLKHNEENYKLNETFGKMTLKSFEHLMEFYRLDKIDNDERYIRALALQLCSARNTDVLCHLIHYFPLIVDAYFLKDLSKPDSAIVDKIMSIEKDNEELLKS